MIVTYIYPPAEGEYQRVQLRCKNFADAIRRTGVHQSHLLALDEFLNQTEEAQLICSSSDILIIYKHLYGPALRMVQFWKARDKRVLVDFDEALDLIPSEFEEHRFWTCSAETKDPVDHLTGGRTLASPLEQFRWGLRLVDTATVPSLRLVENWSALANVCQVPDYLNINHYPMHSQPERASNRVTVGIQCQAISSEGLAAAGLLPAVEEVARLRPQARFLFFSLAGAAAGRPPASEQILYMPRIPYHQWPTTLAGVDIGVAAVHDAYGMHSSHVSLTEYMVLRIPWLASDLPPFRGLQRYGWLVPNTREDWKQALLEVIDYLDAYRKEASAGPFLYALGQDVSANINKVLNLYQSIL